MRDVLLTVLRRNCARQQRPVGLAALRASLCASAMLLSSGWSCSVLWLCHSASVSDCHRDSVLELRIVQSLRQTVYPAELAHASQGVYSSNKHIRARRARTIITARATSDPRFLLPRGGPSITITRPGAPELKLKFETLMSRWIARQFSILLLAFKVEARPERSRTQTLSPASVLVLLVLIYFLKS